MLRPFLTGALAFVLLSAAPFGRPHAEPAQSQATSLNAVKTAVLAATGYDDRTVELTATEVQFVVTVVNSALVSAAARENEARRIVEAIARSTADKPEFKTVQAIHIDYVKREVISGHTETVDGLDFRKDPDGNFRHHIT